VHPSRLHGGGEERQVVGRQQVQRPPHEPCLDERLALPQSVSNVLDPAFDPYAGLQLGGRHDLGLNAPDLTYCAGQVLLRQAAYEVMALEPEGVHLRPGELFGGCRLGLQITRMIADWLNSLRN
jgi:hypothetical protein